MKIQNTIQIQSRNKQSTMVVSKDLFLPEVNKAYSTWANKLKKEHNRYNLNNWFL